MANRRAVANGNWSNPAIWDGGTLPTSADDVYANGFNVTIDQSVTVLSIRTTAQSPAVAGGSFTITNGITITADLYNGNANAFVFSLNSPNNASIVGNLFCGFGVGVLLLISGSGTINITGNLSANQNAQCVNITGSGGTLNVTGNATGNASGGYAVQTSSSSNINITGQVAGGSVNSSQGLNLNGSANVTINGTVIAGGSSVAILISSGASANVVVNGHVTSSAGAHGVSGGSTSASFTLNGNASNVSGMLAVLVPKVFIGASVSSWSFTQSNLTTNRTLYSAETLPGSPSSDDVREGTVYGPSLEITGTLIVPNPSNVRKGVATDDTIGTAELTAEDILEAIEASTNPIAERLRNVSTVQTTGGQITSFSS